MSPETTPPPRPTDGRLNRAAGEKHSVAAAISLFGFNLGAAPATAAGVLIEVPVMLLLVKVVNGSKGRYDAGAKA